jgi:hypothetical protein
MEIALVVYGHERLSPDKAKDWCRKLSATEPLIINNDPASLLPEEHPGDNSAYEFSAYQQACLLFRTEGPFLIANDTLFYNHWSAGWKCILRKLQKKDIPSPSVIGDIRRERIGFPEKKPAFLASWIFYLPDRASLTAFSESLETAILQAEKKPSDAYEVYVNNWLTRKSSLSGWHGSADEENYIRKKKVIRMEHELSRELESRGLMHSIGDYRPEYPLIRIFERLKTRYYAIFRS